MKPLRNFPIFRKQTERTQDEKTASMGRNAAQKVTKAAKNCTANEEPWLYRLVDPPRDPHQRLLQSRTGQTAPRVGNLHKPKRNVKAETAAESRCLPELVYRH